MTLKWLHKKLSNIYSVAPMVFLMLFASYRSTPGTNSVVTNYTAKDMFTSIFFGSGELANSIPDLQQFNVRNYTTDPKVINQASLDQEQIYNTVNAEHSNYMASLKNAVASGDHMRIQSALQEGARYVKEAYSTLHPEVDTEIQDALARDFANQVDVKNATPDELKRAINDYVKSDSSSKIMAAQLCVVLLLLVAVAIVLLLLIGLVAEGGQNEATLAKEMIVYAIATSGAK